MSSASASTIAPPASTATTAIQATTDVSLFGYKLSAIPTVAVVLLTLVAGVLYSFGLYLIAYFSKRRANKEKELKRKNTERAKELKSQEEELEAAKASLPPAKGSNAAAPGGRVIAQTKKKKGGGLSIFGRKKRRR